MPATNDLPEKQRGKRPSFYRGGGGEILAILFLLAFFSQLRSLFLPLLFLITIVLLVYGYVRVCFFFGRSVGVIGVCVLCLGTLSFGANEYHVYRLNVAFLDRLSKYDNVTVRRGGILPTSPIIQVSLKKRITDDDLAELTLLPELHGVTHVYLTECKVTDRGLDIIELWKNVEYVCIESDVISDTAIEQYQDRHPACRVIPYGRNEQPTTLGRPI